MKTQTKLPAANFDNKIYAKFSGKTIEKKKVNKVLFQQEFGLREDGKAMLVAITVQLTEKNGFGVLQNFLSGIETLNTQLVVLGSGTATFRKVIFDFQKKHPHDVAILETGEENLRKIYAASDVSIFFVRNGESEREIQNSSGYGCVPIAPESFVGICENYNPNLESGNSFLFAEQNFFSAFAATVRAAEHFRFPFDWRLICKNAMET